MKRFTIKDLYSDFEVEGIRLAAGFAAADNEITNVNIADNPNVFDWLYAGDFLITTGYIFVDNEELQVKAIHELAKIGCAGIGIKTRRFFDSIPQRMIEEADSCGVPLLELPYNYSLAQISEHIHKHLGSAQDALSAGQLYVYNKLSSSIINGESLKEVTTTLSSMLGNSVIILDKKWRILEYAETQDDAQPLSTIIDLNSDEPVFTDMELDSISGNNSFPKSVIRDVVLKGISVKCRIKTVSTKSETLGYILVIETVKKLGSQENLILEASANAVALELVHLKKIEDISQKMKVDFFEELLSGNVISKSTALAIAEMYGMENDCSYTCFVVRFRRMFSSSSEEYQKLQGNLHKLRHIIAEEAEMANRSVVFAARESHTVAFIKTDPGEARSRRIDVVYGSLMSRIAERCEKELFGVEVMIGVGNPCENIFRLKESFSQAMAAIEPHVSSGNTHVIVSFFCNQLVYNMLNNAIDKESMKQFYELTLKKLVDYDAENDTDLVETLEMYYATNCNVSLAAKNMYLHRNSFSYRLLKITDVLEADPREISHAMELQLALMIRKMI